MLEKFEQLMISEPVLRALNDMGFEEPTPIQQEAIPVAMSGKDMIPIIAAPATQIRIV